MALVEYARVAIECIACQLLQRWRKWIDGTFNIGTVLVAVGALAVQVVVQPVAHVEAIGLLVGTVTVAMLLAPHVSHLLPVAAGGLLSVDLRTRKTVLLRNRHRLPRNGNTQTAF